jgi:hypothetical protein
MSRHAKYSEKYLMDVMKNAARSLIPPAAVLFTHLFRYEIWPQLTALDVVAHFLGGFSIAWMGMILISGLRKRRDIPAETPHWFTDYAVFGTVLIAGVFWEFMEWGSDTFLASTTQFTIPETMNDLLMDTLGGALFIFIYAVRRRLISKK